MGRKVKDLVGQEFNGIKVLGYAGADEYGATWECECYCGAIFYAYSHHLKSGKLKSCGCYRASRMKEIQKLGVSEKKRLSKQGGYRYYKDNPNYIYKEGE